MARVTVYYFKGYDIGSGLMILSKQMATREWIDKHNYTPLMDTAKKVDTSSLDDNGLY